MLFFPLLTACGPNLATIANDEAPVSTVATWRVDQAPSLSVMGTLPVAAPPFVGQPRPPQLTLEVVAPPLLEASLAPAEPIVEVDAGVVLDPTGPRGVDVSPHLALGLPDSSGVGQARRWLLVRSQFVSSYDTARKVPNWTSWTLDARDFGTASRATTFKSDPNLPTGTPQAVDADYRNSGFDRGHLCPSADRTATDADNDATFFLTNVVPQTHASNAGPWLDLEDESRTLADAGKHLVIIAGPTFGATSQTIGSGVAVPLALFKVAVVMDATGTVNANTKIYAAVVPNAAVVSGSWRQYQVTARSLELLTGLDFLADLPRATQDVLENRLDP
jgi:endonuclease G